MTSGKHGENDALMRSGPNPDIWARKTDVSVHFACLWVSTYILSWYIHVCALSTIHRLWVSTYRWVSTYMFVEYVKCEYVLSKVGFRQFFYNYTPICKNWCCDKQLASVRIGSSVTFVRDLIVLICVHAAIVSESMRMFSSITVPAYSPLYWLHVHAIVVWEAEIFMFYT